MVQLFITTHSSPTSETPAIRDNNDGRKQEATRRRDGCAQERQSLPANVRPGPTNCVSRLPCSPLSCYAWQFLTPTALLLGSCCALIPNNFLNTLLGTETRLLLQYYCSTYSNSCFFANIPGMS